MPPKEKNTILSHYSDSSWTINHYIIIIYSPWITMNHHESPSKLTTRAKTTSLTRTTSLPPCPLGPQETTDPSLSTAAKARLAAWISCSDPRKTEDLMELLEDLSGWKCGNMWKNNKLCYWIIWLMVSLLEICGKNMSCGNEQGEMPDFEEHQHRKLVRFGGKSDISRAIKNNKAWTCMYQIRRKTMVKHIDLS